MNRLILKPNHAPPPSGWGKVLATWHFYNHSMFSLCNQNAYSGALHEQPGDGYICWRCKERLAAITAIRPISTRQDASWPTTDCATPDALEDAGLDGLQTMKGIS